MFAFYFQRGNLAGSNASVYQGMPSNAYPGANMYGQANTPMQMSQNPPLQNFGNTTLVVTPTYLTYANNVKFRKLPFYNVKHEVLKPIIIGMNFRLAFFFVENDGINRFSCYSWQ